jgi:hypothetical protein
MSHDAVITTLKALRLHGHGPGPQWAGPARGLVVSRSDALDEHAASAVGCCAPDGVLLRRFHRLRRQSCNIHIYMSGTDGFQFSSPCTRRCLA